MRGYLFILLAALLWGLIGPFSRLAFAQGLLPMEVAFWRAVLSWVLFGLHALASRDLHCRGRDMPALALFGLAGVALFYAAYQVAVNRGGAALAAVLLYTAPAWVVVLARIFLAEAITAVKGLALLLTSAGVAGVSLGGGAGSGLHLDGIGLAAGLTAGFCYSLYYVCGKHFASRYSAPNLFALVLPVGIVCLWPLVTFAPKNGTAWAALGALALLCTYGAYFCYYLGLKTLEAGRASIVATLEPVIAAAVAFFWWGEYFTPAGYAGSLLILGGVGVMLRDSLRAPREGSI
jgi:drug/metabolite transporter (DMT)-like permease